MGLMAGLMAGLVGGQFAIDHGGTCTDIVARGSAGRIIARKLLTETPEQSYDAAIVAARRTVVSFGRDDVPGRGFARS
jgi:N-methylhydantoinase A/oxoprolinase/acetone carboxylase beta subunit